MHTKFCLLFLDFFLEVSENLSILLGYCSALFKTVFYHREASRHRFSATWTNTGTCWEFELCMFPLWLPHWPGVFCLLSHHDAQLGHDKDIERSFPEPRNRNHTHFSKIHYFSLMVCLALESIPHIGNPASLSFQFIALP